MINTVSNSVTASIAVGSVPASVAISHDGRRVFIGNQSGNSVSVINTATNTVIATVSAGIFQPQGLAVTPDNAKVYVASSSNNTVSVINTATNTVTANVNVGFFPVGVVVAPGGDKVYVANRDNTVSVISTSTDTVTASVPVGVQSAGLTITPDGTRVYVANEGGDSVSVISTATNTVTATVNLPPFAPNGPYGVAVTPDGSKVYVSTIGAGTVSVIDTATNAVIGSVNVGSFPSGIAVTPDGSKVHVVNNFSSTVSVISTADNLVTTTIPVGFAPASLGAFITNLPYNAGILRSVFFWLEDVDGNQQFNAPPDRAFAFGGVPGDIPISGDWNGSGTTKVGIYRPVSVYLFWITTVTANSPPPTKHTISVSEWRLTIFPW